MKKIIENKTKSLPPKHTSQLRDKITLQHHETKQRNANSLIMADDNQCVLPLPPSRVLSIQDDNIDYISRDYVDMTVTQKGNNLPLVPAVSNLQNSSCVDVVQNNDTKEKKLTSDKSFPSGYVDMSGNKTTQSVVDMTKIKTEIDDVPPPLPIKTKIGLNLRLNIKENMTKCQTENSNNIENKITVEIPNIYEAVDSRKSVLEPILEPEMMTSELKPNAYREDVSKFKSALIEPQETEYLLRFINREGSTKKKTLSLKKVLGIQKVNKENLFILEMFNNQLRDSDTLILKVIKYAGMLVISPTTKDNDETRVVIADSYITWNAQKLEKNIRVENIISIEAVDAKSNEAAMFEIIWWEKESGTRVQKFAARTIEERDKWMQNIYDSVTCIFTNELTHRFTRAGWLHVKEGTVGTWSACRMLLRDRELFYCVNPGKIYVSDLRMVRSITECRIPGFDANGEQETVILLELGSRVFFLRALNEQDLNCWSTCIKSAALKNGPQLDQQQLTRDFVPILVEKCINFVATHGSCSEGIYRRLESGAVTQDIISEFKSNAWDVQLSIKSYSEHVVAAALKLYFSELPEPLIPTHLASDFRSIAMEADDIDTKVSRYRILLHKLPQVFLNTSQRLFRHLHLLHLQSDKNMMDASNLAYVWSSILIRQNLEVSLHSYQRVIEDLIAMFPHIFDVSEGDLQRELQIQDKIEMFQDERRVPSPSSPTSDLLLVWVSMGGYYSPKQEKVFIGPDTTAGEVVRQLGMSEDYMLQEYILGGALARPLLMNVKVNEILLRWSEWDLEYRKDNKLVLAPCLFYKDIMQMKTPRQHVTGELKFGDTSKKDFKTYTFEINHGILSCYKDAKNNNKLKEWKIEDIVWYLGFEPNRNPNTKWTITFIEKDTVRSKRLKERAYFGFTLGGTSKETLIQWSYAFLHTVYIKQISDAISKKSK